MLQVAVRPEQNVIHIGRAAEQAAPPRETKPDLRRAKAVEKTPLVRKDRSRDDLLTDFAKKRLTDSYLLPGESYQDLFARVAAYYGSNESHAQRIYDYISRLWFIPATPVLSNGGTTRGLPVSCFLNSIEDSRESIFNGWTENNWLASEGGGVGTSWSQVRSIGETVKGIGKTAGIIPFIKVMDSNTLAVSQGSLRRGSAAVYLSVRHPEIQEFISLRRTTTGDPNRRAKNLHNAVVIPDDFMEAVNEGRTWDLTSPRDGSVIKTVNARELWASILETRMETGEPYIMYEDTVNRALAEHHKLDGLKVESSNLCIEIMLPTGRDYQDRIRTAVCCLSSLNVEKWEDWKDDPNFIPDVLMFLDNVLQDFIDNAPDSMENARYSATMERSVGLGVMGFHSLLQQKGIAFESPMAKGLNLRLFRHIREQSDRANEWLAKLRGPCPDAARHGVMKRFSYDSAHAPTASISIIAGASPSTEVVAANVYLAKSLSGSTEVRNPYLDRLLDKKLAEGKIRDKEAIWSSVTGNQGSVQHLSCLDDHEKAVFKTAFEVDQRWVIEHAADRQEFIQQSQSINLFLPANADKMEIHGLHWMAWKRGVKSLYYLRSLATGRAERVSREEAGISQADAPNQAPRTAMDLAAYEGECLACQ